MQKAPSPTGNPVKSEHIPLTLSFLTKVVPRKLSKGPNLKFAQRGERRVLFDN